MASDLRRAEVIISAADGGGRIDRLLAASISDLSRSRLKTLILAGQVEIGGRTICDPGHRVNAGDVIVVTVPPPEPAEPQGEPIALNVVFEDDQIIVIDKPRGLVVHPAAGNWSGTLVNALIAHCGASLSGIGGVIRPGIVHRLDKDTTGLMVVAKTDRAHRALAAQFADHGRTGPLRRGYLAFVWGAPDRPKGTIDQPIDRHSHARDKMSVRAGGREAVTHWEVLKRYRAPMARSLPACWPAGWKPGGPTRSGFIWPILGTRCWAMTFTGRASRPRRLGWHPRPPRRSNPLEDRPCMLIYWDRTPEDPRIGGVPLGTTCRPCSFRT